MTPKQARRLSSIEAGVTYWNNAISGSDIDADIPDTSATRPVDRLPHIRTGFSTKRHRP